MTIDELKRALVEVRELCVNKHCSACPFHKTEEDSNIPYCPMYEDMNGNNADYPGVWDIDDWKEDTQDATQGTDQAE